MLQPRTQDLFRQTLTAVEAHNEQHGWDLPPDLIALFDHPLSPAYQIQADATLFDASVWHPDTEIGHADLPTAVALHRLAQDAGSGAMRDWLRSWLHQDGRRCVGFAIVFEAWLGTVQPGYWHGDLAHAPASARRETRVVAAVDIDLRIYRVLRVRGAYAPTVTTWAVPPPRVRDTRIATGLTRLVNLANAL